MVGWRKIRHFFFLILGCNVVTLLLYCEVEAIHSRRLRINVAGDASLHNGHESLVTGPVVRGNANKLFVRVHFVPRYVIVQLAGRQGALWTLARWDTRPLLRAPPSYSSGTCWLKSLIVVTKRIPSYSDLKPREFNPDVSNFITAPTKTVTSSQPLGQKHRAVRVTLQQLIAFPGLMEPKRP
jgi:hypothetical protein